MKQIKITLLILVGAILVAPSCYEGFAQQQTKAAIEQDGVIIPLEEIERKQQPVVIPIRQDQTFRLEESKPKTALNMSLAFLTVSQLCSANGELDTPIVDRRCLDIVMVEVEKNPSIDYKSLIQIADGALNVRFVK